MGDTVIVGAIAEYLSIPAPRRREQVVAAGHTGNATVARSALGDVDPTTRALALGALARCGRLGVADLTEAAGDPVAMVRRRVAEEAGRLHVGDPRPVAARLLGDEDDSVVEMAAWALGEHRPRPEDVEALSALATGHREPLCREAAVAALGALADPGGLTAILAGTRDRATVRRRAVPALAAFSGPEVEQALETALTDRDWQVRQAAEDLLGS
jgi:HEAT repeat protein